MINHLPHLEDLILLEGELGLQKVIRVLSDLRDRNYQNISIKWDGAPAVFIGSDVDGNRFVAKKSIFNKKPIIYRSTSEIRDQIKKEQLADKLIECFHFAPEIEFGHCVQGDLMYVIDDVNSHSIDYVDYIGFQPNTISYNFKFDSAIAKQIADSQIGIAFHTKYSIDKDLKLTMIPFEEVQSTLHCFSLSSKYESFPHSKRRIHFKLNDNQPIHQYETRYMNSFIRNGEEIPDLNHTHILYKDIIKFKNKYIKDMNLLDFSNIHKMNVTVREDGSYENIYNEGFVYKSTDIICKIVDRSKFSFANFSAEFIKGWN